MQENRSDSELRAAATTWLGQIGIAALEIEVLRGDVSLRRYIRARTSDRSVIVAVYPSQIRPSCSGFLTTTRLLSEIGVRVPEVLASDCARGFMMIEDLGDGTLYDLKDADSDRVTVYFWQAVSDIARLQSIDPDRVQPLNPPLDGPLLRGELEHTTTRLVDLLPEIRKPTLSEGLGRMSDEICQKLAAEPVVACHRDFMARNLVPVDPFPCLAVLDHQDLRPGPRYYDLASMLNDSLFPPAPLEEAILDRVIGSRPEDLESYHRAAAQRTLKAVGTYLMFAERGFDRHRKLIPTTLARSLHHLSRLPEASGLYESLAEAVQPLLDSTLEANLLD